MTTASSDNRPIANWTPDRLPDLAGKTYVITGGNSGIGLEAAMLLAGKGATLIIAARDPSKGAEAVASLPPPASGAHEAVALDLASLDSVRSAAATVRERHHRIDALINNAGIMQTPQRTTVDGFELQFATNHLGHFLLSGLLYEPVKAANGRFVTVSSIAHRFGTIQFDDLMHAKNYDPTRAYSQSKLANLMFTLALHRRLHAGDAEVMSIGCHPGYSATRLQSTGPEGVMASLYKVLNPLLAQPARKGAFPTVLAAAGIEAVSGGYYGPKAMGEARGPVGEASVAARAQDQAAQDRLWEETERLLNFSWPAL